MSIPGGKLPKESRIYRPSACLTPDKAVDVKIACPHGMRVLAAAAPLALLLLLASPASAEHARFLRWAFLVDVRTGVGVATTTETSDPRQTYLRTLFILPSLTVGVRLVDRLELRIGYLPLWHWAIVPDASGYRFIHAGVLSTTVDLVQFLRNRGNWFLVGGVYAGTTSDLQGEFVRNEPLVGYNFATGIRFALSRVFALGFEIGALGDVTDPGQSCPQLTSSCGSNEQQTHSGYIAIDGTFYVGR
jgi:hypothetical protein